MIRSFKVTHHRSPKYKIRFTKKVMSLDNLDMQASASAFDIQLALVRKRPHPATLARGPLHKR